MKTIPPDPSPLAEFGPALVVLALVLLALAIGKHVLIWVLDGSNSQEDQ